MKSLKHLNKYFWKYRWRLILGILFATLSTFFGIYVAVLVRKATDFMTHAVVEKYSFEITAEELLKYGLYILGTTIVCGVFMFLMRQTIIVISRHIEFDLKNEIFAHYQSLDMAFYRRNNTGDLMNRISEDVSRVRMFIGPAVMYFASTISTLVLVSGTMSGVNMKLTLYVLFPLPILVVTIYLVSNRINKMSNKVQEQLSNLSTIAQETFSGIRVLKAYSQENTTGEIFSKESGMYRKRNLSLTLTEALFGPFILLLMGFSTILTIYVGGKQAIAGQISYGNIVEFIIYVGKLTWPVASLGWVTSLVQRAAASQARINEFLNQQSEITSQGLEAAHPSVDATTVNGEIEFKNVSFIYPDSGMKAINKLSFKVNTGQSIAIIGKTGSGKSSVASLICRLYDVTEGEIGVDGKNIKEWNRSFLRRHIGYVPQDTFLFSDTVENNIAFGCHDLVVQSAKLGGEESPVVSSKFQATRSQLIKQAAQDAGIESEILRFPDKYNTMIGERGITLSGGQKQRIAIARAIIGSPRILIFDDCLSAVDTETEATILGNLRKVMQDKTTILISHRVSTVKDATYIIALNKGGVEEAGSHQQLMDKKGFYYELYKMQLAE
jgi:ATP-binding cassette, subfamily B, multidrug efflux pump